MIYRKSNPWIHIFVFLLISALRLTMSECAQYENN